MLAANKPEVLLFFYLMNSSSANIFVLDETGVLFCDCLENGLETTLLGHFGHFFDSVEFRQNSATAVSSGADAQSDAGELVSRGQYSRLTESVNGRYSLEHVEQDQGDAGICIKLQVIGERVGNETCFTVYCDGRKFSTREHRSSLFAVVSEHVLA